MAFILTTDDFEYGRYKIPLDPSSETNDFPMYLDRVEDEYLPLLFGVELYDLFVIDWNSAPAGAPTDPRFSFIYEPFNYQDNAHGLLQSEGIKELLAGLVYFLYVRDNITRITTEGLKETTGSNSINVSGTRHDILSRYNEAIQNWKVIQYYMNQIDPALYPEFKGIDQRYNHTF